MHPRYLMPAFAAVLLLGCPPARDAAPEPRETGAEESPAARQAEAPSAEAAERYRAAKEKLAAASYREAAEAFRALTAAHPEYGPAWYGLAQAYTQARAQEKCSVDGADPDGIRQAVTNALTRGGATMAQAAEDPLLAPARSMLWFQLGVFGRVVSDREDVARALTQSEGLVARGTAEGMWGPMAGADFEEGGRAVLWRIDPAAERPRVEARGRFTVDEDGTVNVELDGPPPWEGDRRRFSGRLEQPGLLDLEGFGRIGDNDAECDA